MRKTGLAAICALSTALTGCARWQPALSDPDTLPSACGLLRAPRVADIPAGGLRGTYQFVTQDAPSEDKVAFLGETDEHGFGLVPMTVNLNGKDTLIAHGPGVLRTQAQVDAEFAAACGLGHGGVYLTHVNHSPATGGATRVR